MNKRPETADEVYNLNTMELKPFRSSSVTVSSRIASARSQSCIFDTCSNKLVRLPQAVYEEKPIVQTVPKQPNNFLV